MVEKVRIPVVLALRVVPTEDNLKDFFFEKKGEKIIQRKELDATLLGYAKDLRAINRRFVAKIMDYAIPTEIGWITTPPNKPKLVTHLNMWKDDLMKFRKELIEFAKRWEGKNEKYYEKAMKLADKIEKYVEASDVIEIDLPKKSLDVILSMHEEKVKESFMRYAERMKVATPKEKKNIEKKMKELEKRKKIIEDFKRFVKEMADRYGNVI